MLRKLITYSVVLASMTGCSSKYVGLSSTKARDKACAIDRRQCNYTIGDFKINYNLHEIGRDKYKLAGSILWTNKDISGVYDKIERMQLKFIFLDDSKIIEEENIYIRGHMYKKHTFETTISGVKNINRSLPIGYSYRITE